MNELFPEYYRPSPAEFEKLFGTAVFVFDANMLLHLYRYPPKARNDLLKILHFLAEENRLWLPFQAALEFQINRLEVISSQRNKYGEVKKVILDIQSDLKSKLDKLNLRKRHSSIDPDELLNEIQSAFDKYRKKLDSYESEQLDVHHEDKIRLAVDELFKEKIGEPFTQAELNDIFEEGSRRYKMKQPPGYRDEADKKGTYSFYRDIVIRREFGDLIVWKEIIRFIEQRKPDGLIFVTDDNKSDWWAEISGQTIGPQPALLAEIAQSGLKSFYMYNSERFMTLASEAFNVQVEADSIEQVKRVSRERVSVKDRYLRFKQIQTFLMNLYGGICQICKSPHATEASLIVPLSLGGRHSPDNALLLCGPHQREFSIGAFTIGEDNRLIGLPGELSISSSHELNPTNLEYHRTHIYVS